MPFFGPDRGPSTPGVTVVVPVYNPSHYIERTIESLLDQTMPRARYEVVFVDDGSDDGTGTRLDGLAAAHPDLVRVIHQPNSGGPGGPRNRGVEVARHEYVFFCDADDWLPQHALEAMLARAVLDGSDIVVAKSIGLRRPVPLALHSGGDFVTTLAATPGLFTTLTCQKLFRRDFLRDGGIRFPEGPVRIEDYIFMTEAYLRAGPISILGSTPCYVFESRTDAGNITATPPPPFGRLASTARMIDVVEAYAADDTTRDVALSRTVQSGLLGVLTGRRFRASPEAEREALFAAVAELMRARIPASVISRLDGRSRRLARAVLDGDRAFVEAWTAWESRLQARARTTAVVARDGRVYVEFDVALTLDEDVVALERVDGRVLLHPSPDVPGYDVTDDVRRATVHLTLRNARTTENWRVGCDLQSVPGAITAEALELSWRARAVIDVGRAGGGERLDEGTWSVRAHVVCLGPARMVPIGDEGAIPTEAGAGRGGAGVRVIRTRRGRLAVRVAAGPGRVRRRGAATSTRVGSGAPTVVANRTRRRVRWRRRLRAMARGLSRRLPRAAPGVDSWHSSR